MALANELIDGPIEIRYENIVTSDGRKVYGFSKTVYGRVGLPGKSFESLKKRLKEAGFKFESYWSTRSDNFMGTSNIVMTYIDTK